MKQKILHLLQAVPVYGLYYLFKAMPVSWASAAGGFMSRTLGPNLPASQRALKHIRMAFPDRSPENHRQILIDMWDNLGRTFAEYPHLRFIGRYRTSVITTHELPSDKAVVLFCAHIANWEINAFAGIEHFKRPTALTYRAPNNPWVHRLLNRIRSIPDAPELMDMLPKSKTTARDLMQAVKDKKIIGAMVDQKFNEGPATPFFNHPARTNHAFVKLCQKYDIPFIPMKTKRLKGARFEIHIGDPIALFNSDGSPLPVEDILLKMNQTLESWITEDPGQWLWIHNRWGKDV